MTISLKPSQALLLLHQTSLAQVRSDMPDLTTRQLTILLTIYLEVEPHTVRALAARLGVTKPVISRALDTMGATKLIARQRDPRDRRNVIVQRTEKGANYLKQLGKFMAERSERLPG